MMPSSRRRPREGLSDAAAQRTAAGDSRIRSPRHLPSLREILGWYSGSRVARSVPTLLVMLAPLLSLIPSLLPAEDRAAHAAAAGTYLVAAALISLPSRRRLDELATTVSVLAMTMCVVLSRAADAGGDARISSHWYHLGLLALVVALVIRQRTGWAWAMCWIVLALAATYGARSPHGLIMGALATAPAFGLLLVSTLMVQEVDRLVERRRDARALSASARTDDDAEQDTVNASIRRVHDVRQLTGPLLERIAGSSAPVSAQEIEGFRIVEAQLRDSIRGRSIATPQLSEATRRARERGVSVDILDERGRVLPDAILGIVSRHAAAVLDAAHSGSVTIRAFSEDDPTAVLIVHDPGNDDDAVALEIAQDTGEVSEF